MSIRSRRLIVLLGHFYPNWFFCQLCLPITEEEMLKYTIKMVFLSMSHFNSIFISAFRYSLLVCRCFRIFLENLFFYCYFVSLFLIIIFLSFGLEIMQLLQPLVYQCYHWIVLSIPLFSTFSPTFIVSLSNLYI